MTKVGMKAHTRVEIIALGSVLALTPAEHRQMISPLQMERWFTGYELHAYNNVWH